MLFNIEEETINPVEEAIVPSINTSTIYEGNDATDLITAIEGSRWEDVYFSQMLAEDDYPRRLDFLVDPSLQQYTRINNHVMFVTEGLEGTTSVTVITTVTGTATLYPGITPNQWDMFVATMKDGRVGLFTITEPPTRKTFYDTSCYSITYELVDYFNEKYEAELQRKTVKVLYYDPSNPTEPGTEPLAENNNADIRELLVNMINLMYEQFFDLKTRTLILTDERVRIYDPHVVDFISSILPTTLRGRRPRLTKYETPTGHYQELYRTIYDIFLDGQAARLPYITSKVGNVSDATFHSQYVMMSVFLVDIDRIVHPSDAETMYGTVSEDSLYTYVFTDSFYSHDVPNMTPLETTVYEAMFNRSFDAKVVTDLCETIRDEPIKTQFYFIPVLVWLLLKQLK